MSLARHRGLRKLCRPLLQATHEAHYSGVSDFVKNVRSAVESNQDVKRAVDELAKTAQTLTGRAKSAADSFSRAADPGSGQAAQQAADRSTREAGTSQQAGAASQQATDSTSEHTDARASTSDSSAGRDGSSSSSSSSSASGTSDAARLPFASRMRSMLSNVRREVEEAVLPRQEVVSATRARDPGIRPAGSPGSSEVSIAKQPESRWQKQWAEMQDKFGGHPIFKRLRGFSDNRVFNKTKEVADDIRERWETSDSRFVQRIQDMRDSMSTETEQAQALREIRSRYPDFDMVRFVRILKGDVPLVIKAYLEGNTEALREHCAPEMMERFAGIIAAQKAEGLTTDSTILDVSDVELVDLKFVDRSPVVVVQFTCQQINCARDKFGNVVEGGPQDVQRVYYYWALQQDDAGFVGEDGKFHPPRWQLREMMVRGMHNLL